MHTLSSEPTTPSNSVLRRFEQERLALQCAISGLSSSISSSGYASLLFRRLLVVAFLQAHGFLASDPLYLSHQLQTLYSTASAPDRFFHRCLLPLFQDLSSATPGSLPALDLPLFALRTYETGSLSIPDQAFERLFAFLSTFHWSLSPSSNRPAHVLGPDILASLFEQQLEQKQLGAYYTRADVTLYTTTNTLIPYLLTTLSQNLPDVFSPQGALLSLLQSTPNRYIPSALSAPDYLPLETEHEFRARQTRYTHLLTHLQHRSFHSVFDLVSANLDLQQLLLDTIATSHEPDFVIALYMVLSQTTILDPTCGSGAFLLAALSLLHPLYSACLTRLTYFLQTTPLSREQQGCCEDILSALEKAPNPTFFIVKRCITTHLYGVDIMEDAVEICQICLYLTLLASLEHTKELPLFSSLSFHIRTGNALVGFVHPPTSVAEPILGTEQLRMDSLLAQTHGLSSTALSDPTTYAPLLAQWRKQYRPFHWHLEFPSCIQRGGFSVLIGNPPFVEYHSTYLHSPFSHYQARHCGNLYALVIERALSLCRPNESFLGLLLPLSLCAARRFSPLRNLLLDQTAHLWLANFSIFPCRLFEGAFQRLSLLLAHASTGQTCQLSTTHIQRWYTAERPFLLPLISYTPVTSQQPSLFPKLASSLQEQLLIKLLIRSRGQTLADLLLSSPSPHFVYYQEATNYWTKASCTIPYYKKNGVIMHPSHGRFLYFSDQLTAQAVMALLNSSLFYLWFATYSDGFHLAHSLVKSFPVDSDLVARTDLALLAQRLQEHISLHTRRSTRNTHHATQAQPAHIIELEEFHMARSKSLLDEIDASLAYYYSFTGEELDFIVTYDGKYRIDP